MFVNATGSDITNSILWGNTAIYGPQIRYYSGTVRIRYSVVEGGCPTGINCETKLITDNPQFVNTIGGDLHLGANSPALDTGLSDHPELDDITTDIDGNPRYVDIPWIYNTGTGTQPYIDLGPYEAQWKYRLFMPLILQ